MMVCLTCLALGIIGFVDSSSHELLLENAKVFHEYKKHEQEFVMAYKSALGLLIGGSLCHFCSLCFMLDGVRRTQPGQMIPEMIVMGLFMGVLLFATVSLTILL